MKRSQSENLRYWTTKQLEALRIWFLMPAETLETSKSFRMINQEKQRNVSFEKLPLKRVFWDSVDIKCHKKQRMI